MMAGAAQSFLGTGWAFPPAFSRESLSVDTASGERDVHESLHILFSTTLGERIMVPQYGTDLWRRVFSAMTTTVQTEIASGVRRAIVMWEPRIDVLEVLAAADPAEGRVVVTVDYRIRHTNARGNFVYPFYLQEGTLAAPAS